MRVWLWRAAVAAGGARRLGGRGAHAEPHPLRRALAPAWSARPRARDPRPASAPGHVWLTLGEIAAAYALAVAGGLWLGFLLGLRGRSAGSTSRCWPRSTPCRASSGTPRSCSSSASGPRPRSRSASCWASSRVLSVLAGHPPGAGDPGDRGRSMGARPWTVFRKVMLPAMASTMVGGCARAWRSRWWASWSARSWAPAPGSAT